MDTFLVIAMGILALAAWTRFVFTFFKEPRANQENRSPWPFDP